MLTVAGKTWQANKLVCNAAHENRRAEVVFTCSDGRKARVRIEKKDDATTHTLELVGSEKPLTSEEEKALITFTQQKLDSIADNCTEFLLRKGFSGTFEFDINKLFGQLDASMGSLFKLLDAEMDRMFRQLGAETDGLFRQFDINIKGRMGDDEPPRRR